MHKIAPTLEAAINVPFLHIADATSRAIQRAGQRRVGLLGTRFTMEQDFYRDRVSQHGIACLVPEAGDREIIHRVIYEELCLGIIRDASRAEFQRVISALIDRGAQGIILGCTEISLLIDNEDVAIPIFDSTRIHALNAVDHALAADDVQATRSPQICVTRAIPTPSQPWAVRTSQGLNITQQHMLLALKTPLYAREG
jgi:aspartate racemase